ncbi:MAG: hypothetical protein LBJ77_02565 [Holosporales bacterium]|nr:hypothetical protein [Holosporales bacterium]
MASVLRSVFGTYSPALALNILLKKEWAAIAGEVLCDLSEFVEAKFVGNDSIDVHCRILGAASIEARHREQDIAERIRLLTARKNVRVLFKHCSSIPAQEITL